MRTVVMDLLLGSPARAAQAAGAIEVAATWPAVVELCEKWRVLPQLSRRLRDVDVQLPEHTKAEFRALASQAFVRSSVCVERGARALAMLLGAQIPCAGFKGLAAVATLYRGPGDRTLQDVDVLVRPVDLRRAISCLEENGFLRCAAGTLDEYIQFVRNCPGFAGNEAISLTDGKGSAVDLHWRLGQLDCDSLLASVRLERVLGRTVPVVAAPHSLALAVHHGLRNDFAPAEMVRDLLDFEGWLAILDRHGDIQDAIELLHRWRLLEPALAIARIVSSLREKPIGALDASAGVSERRAAADLAELYFHQLRHGEVNADVVYLANPRSLRQIVAGAASGWSRYRAYMRVFEEGAGRPPVPLRRRLPQLVQAVWRLPLSRWRLVRALARAKEAATPSARFAGSTHSHRRIPHRP